MGLRNEIISRGFLFNALRTLLTTSNQNSEYPIINYDDNKVGLNEFFELKKYKKTADKFTVCCFLIVFIYRLLKTILQIKIFSFKKISTLIIIA
jgi:hypothetical protein